MNLPSLDEKIERTYMLLGCAWSSLSGVHMVGLEKRNSLGSPFWLASLQFVTEPTGDIIQLGAQFCFALCIHIIQYEDLRDLLIGSDVLSLKILSSKRSSFGLKLVLS